MAGAPQLPLVLASQTAVGTLYNTYTTAKTVINQTELVPFAANALRVGSLFQIDVWGGLSSKVTTAPTFTFQVMMGSIVVWTSGAIQCTTTAHVLLPFDLKIRLRLDTIGTGTTAKFIGGGTLQGLHFTVGVGADSTTVSGAYSVPATAPAVGTGFDSTIANTMDFWTGISASDSANGIQLYNYSVTHLNPV